MADLQLQSEVHKLFKSLQLLLPYCARLSPLLGRSLCRNLTRSCPPHGFHVSLSHNSFPFSALSLMSCRNQIEDPSIWLLMSFSYLVVVEEEEVWWERVRWWGRVGLLVVWGWEQVLLEEEIPPGKRQHLQEKGDYYTGASKHPVRRLGYA